MIVGSESRNWVRKRYEVVNSEASIPSALWWIAERDGVVQTAQLSRTGDHLTHT